MVIWAFLYKYFLIIFFILIAPYSAQGLGGGGNFARGDFNLNFSNIEVNATKLDDFF